MPPAIGVVVTTGSPTEEEIIIPPLLLKFPVVPTNIGASEPCAKVSPALHKRGEKKMHEAKTRYVIIRFKFFFHYFTILASLCRQKLILKHFARELYLWMFRSHQYN